MKRAAALLAGAALALGLAAHSRDRFDSWVAATVLPPVLSETGAEVRAGDGTLLRAFPVEDGRLRLAVGLHEVDPVFLRLLIAYEDRRFYDHAGVDPLALLRAAAQAARYGRVVSGGSTLTMQVARLLENSGTGSVGGKLRQIRLALALERQLTKEQILSLYLLHAPYGGPVEGIRAASLSWFGKEPRRLTLAEAALLVALPQSPEARRPDRHPDAARAARDRVLARTGMDAGATRGDVPRTLGTPRQDAPHLAESIRQRMPQRIQHRTTLDPALQRQMQSLARRAVAGQGDAVSAAILVADHATGDVLAYVGSPDYTDGQRQGYVDMVAASRSPGSTLKPLIYAMAFDEGLAHPDTLIDDAPVYFGRYAPQNFDGVFRGRLTVRDALSLSLNIPPVLLLDEIGPARLMSTLERAGAAPQLPSGQPGLAVALGGVGLSLRDLVQLYAAIAQGGDGPPLRILQDTHPKDPPHILSPVAAWQVAHILADIAPPAGSAARAGQIAYKTGTSYGHRDAWAIGFDGQHVIGIWLGRPDGSPVPGAFGGDLAAPVLFEAFGRLGSLVPLPRPPQNALILGTAHLPEPLRVFRSRSAAFEPAPDGPEVTFPPEGATLRRSGFGVPLKLRAGRLPLTVLVDGAPVLTGLHSRDALLPLDAPGFARIAVIDADGRSASVEIRLD
ncbi:penicillin-binding protein 1C [Sulfitobacter sp. HNIBRBA3233]|uniref:penicillin-binding protein 1C n=1 Tax=Sulfitobacter marinivivus TaxID=3158558 RepID=UPI0032DE6D47